MSVKAELYDVIRKPIITEKATMASEKGAVVFEVAIDSNKPQIKEAIEALFGVKVKAVNTAIAKGKSKRVLLDRARHQVRGPIPSPHPTVGAKKIICPLRNTPVFHRALLRSVLRANDMSPRPATTAGFFLRRNGKRHRIFSGLTVDSTAAKRLRASTDSERKAGPATPLPPCCPRSGR